MCSVKANTLCPLCFQHGNYFYKDRFRTYYLCSNCAGIYIDKENLPDAVSEKARYDTHNNDVNDIRYQAFVQPIVQAVVRHFTLKSKGLDYGSGSGPVTSKLLGDQSFQIEQYDPFYAPFPELLEQTYDYIISCEVIEHFHAPGKEFRSLCGMLEPGGELILMTQLYRPDIDFRNWYYKNDPTHVFYYQEESFDFIRTEMGFSGLTIDKNLIILKK